MKIHGPSHTHVRGKLYPYLVKTPREMSAVVLIITMWFHFSRREYCVLYTPWSGWWCWKVLAKPANGLSFNSPTLVSSLLILSFIWTNFFINFPPLSRELFWPLVTQQKARSPRNTHFIIKYIVFHRFLTVDETSTVVRQGFWFRESKLEYKAATAC